MHITASRYSSPGYIRVQWPWIGMIQNMTCVVITTYNINGSKIYDEDIQRIMISMKVEDIQWIKISIIVEDIWHTLESSHESWNLMNTRKIKEVAYVECHKYGKSYTQTVTSTCPTMWIEVSRSNIVVHHLITGHWCIPLTDARSPTDNDNGNQGTRVKTNKCE